MSSCKDIFLFIGPPGSGKGSLSQLCVKTFGWVQLSTGNLCRRHIAEQTKIGMQIDFALKSGKLVSDSLVIEMVEDWLLGTGKDSQGIILDGYPRTVAQAEALNDLLTTKFSGMSLEIIRLNISDDEVVGRLSGRFICQNNNCQMVYSLKKESQLAPKEHNKCDVCSSSLIRREDDAESSVRERLKTYYKHENDLLDFYRNKRQGITELHVAKPLEHVFDDFRQLVGID